MKKILAVVFAVSLLATTAMLETVPLSMTYQGRLTDAAGMPQNGNYDMTFRIYDSAIGGNLLSEEVHPGVLVTNGLFDVAPVLTFRVPSSGPVELSHGSLEVWLEVEVEGDELIMPRTRLNSTPFAILSYGLAGDIFTSPGHVMLIPGPPVSDCTYVPLEMAVDSSVTRIRMKPYIPVNDCTYVPLEMSASSVQSKITLQPPDPNMGGSLELSTGVAGSGPSLVMINPGPIQRQTGTSMEFSMVQTQPGPIQDPMLTLNATPSSGSSLVMLNPQPLPPNGAEPWLSLSTDVTLGASLEMFNTEQQPGPVQVPAVQINGGTATEGASLVMRNPGPVQTPLLELSIMNAGGAMDVQSNPDFAKAGSGISDVSISADTIDGRIHASLVYADAAGSPQISKLTISNTSLASMLTLKNGPPASSDDIIFMANSGGAMVGINTALPSEALHVVGNICATGTIGVCSDERYKKNIETITNALALIEKMRGVNFKWRTDEFSDRKFSDGEQVGFIAQELKDVLPELVSQGTDGYYSVDYSRLTPVLVEAVKEQQKEIISLKTEMQELKRLVQALATSNNEIATSRSFDKAQDK